MFKALYSHVNNIIEKYYKFTTTSYYIYNELKQLLNHIIHNEKLKLTEYPGGYSQKIWVGVCGPLPKTLTLFMTKICNFPYPIYDLTKNLIPYL